MKRQATRRRQATARDDLVVVMTCEWCGKEIRLVAGDIGPELQDAGTFLAVHAECLLRRHTSARQS